MTTKIGILLKELATQDGRTSLHEAIDQWVGDRLGITSQQAHQLDVATAQCIAVGSLPVAAASTMGPFFTTVTTLAVSAIVIGGAQEFVQACNLRNRGLDIDSRIRRVVKEIFDRNEIGRKQQESNLEP